MCEKYQIHEGCDCNFRPRQTGEAAKPDDPPSFGPVDHEVHMAACHDDASRKSRTMLRVTALHSLT